MQINLAPIQPVLDRLLRPGELTSEYKAWQTETLWAKVLTVLGLIIFAASLVPQVFGDHYSHLATICGTVAAIAGQAQHILATMIYTGARSDQKESAADLVAKTVSAITQALPLLPAPAPAAPAETPVAREDLATLMLQAVPNVKAG